MPNNLSPETKKLLDSSLIAWENQETEIALDVLNKLSSKSGTEGLSEKWLKELKIRMQWVAFPALIEKDQLELLTKNILIPIHSKGFSLKKAFRIKYLASPTIMWNESVPRILNAMLKNEELLGSQSISIGDNPKARPTIGNWLKDYVQIYGMDKQNEMAVRKYMTDSINAQSLSLPDKKILEELLLLFESTKIFSIKQIMDEVEKIDKQEKQLAKVVAQETKTAKQTGSISQQNVLPQQQASSQQVATQQQFQQTPRQQAATQQKTTPPRQQPSQQTLSQQATSKSVNQQATPQQIPQQTFQPTASKPVTAQSVSQSAVLQQQKFQQPPAPTQQPLRQMPASAQTTSSVPSTSSLPKPEAQGVNFPKRLQPVPLKKPSDGSTIQKTIKQALQTNPRVADQPITSAPISLLGRDTKVSPTVQNWLFDYRSQFGATGNTEDERQEFLFKSINARNLSTEERHRLETIITSHDKDTPLAITKNEGIILFN
ncbi:MAG: hypothetical protein U9Q72_01805 [Patescibacteria group bacterium]|nr:hypothetical protein [Patescibacteria group bacterium]